ncbi:hypothetical protein N1851_014144 [Merluccius polli]|uniref:Uncharacterized protein n=1 Tax=Merluccius polli TaxID=89951 RepID=A0AA47P3N9_MERPO|nr:hypothetical protein N1851_014144 [Merluccius polli]
MVPLERTFFTKLDFYTPTTQEIFSKKGGVAGTKIRPLLDSLSQDISRVEAREDQAEQVLKICVFHTSEEDEGASDTDVSIVIEGNEIMLMGIIYAMNLSYPPKTKYTFEVFQKPLLELDVLKLSLKILSLRNKLIA